jgi:hypothetical protein
LGKGVSKNLYVRYINYTLYPKLCIIERIKVYNSKADITGFFMSELSSSTNRHSACPRKNVALGRQNSRHYHSPLPPLTD